MMFVSLMPAMATMLTDKKATAPAEQSQPALALGEFPRLQTLSTDTFAPTTNVERSGNNPLEVFIDTSGANKRITKWAKDVLAKYELNPNQLTELAEAFKARHRSAELKQVTAVQEGYEQAITDIVETLVEKSTEVVSGKSKKSKK